MINLIVIVFYQVNKLGVSYQKLLFPVLLQELIDLNKKGIISFQNVVTFNMDEYVGLPKEHPESYYFLRNGHIQHPGQQHSRSGYWYSPV